MDTTNKNLSTTKATFSHGGLSQTLKLRQKLVPVLWDIVETDLTKFVVYCRRPLVLCPVNAIDYSELNELLWEIRRCC